MLRSRTTIVLFILLFLFVTVILSPVQAEQVDATAAISSAKNMILDGFSAAKTAEAYGAKITSLVDTLNEAVSYLSQAELAYAGGDFDVALDFASESQNVLNDFTAKANFLLADAKQQQIIDFLINFLGSIIGAIVVVRGGFAVWSYLKKKYKASEAHIT